MLTILILNAHPNLTVGRPALGCGQCASGTCIVDPDHSGATTTIWDWLSQLSTAGLSGYNDWQIPALGSNGLTPELSSILAAPFPLQRTK